MGKLQIKWIWSIVVLLLSPGFCPLFAQVSSTRPMENMAEQEKSFAQLRFTGSQKLTAASPNFKVGFYRCEWTIDPAIRFISGKVSARFTITVATDRIVFDLSDTLSVDSILYHGSKTVFQRPGGDALEIVFPSTLGAGQADSVSIYYNGVPRNPPSYRPFVQSVHSGSPIIWTLSEPYGSKEWWPCRNGLDDKADSIDIIVRSPSAYRASANGVMVADDTSGGFRTVYFKSRYPIASYLVAMAVTNYVVFRDSVTAGGQQIPLSLTTYPEFAGNATKIFNNTRYAMQLLCKHFGTYPFNAEQYAQTAFHSGGGMEHQTNSFISTTDVRLITHELGHQWFGDKITCGSWKDIWLNEGFATFCEWLYYKDTMKQDFAPALKASIITSITALPGGSVKVDDTTSADRVFSGRLSYQKGAYVLRMLQWLIGDSSFFSGVKRYLADPKVRYAFAGTEDLKRNLELESGRDLSSFFTKWYEGQGYPIYRISWTQDSSNMVYLTLNQTTSHPSVGFYDMPVPVQFKSAARDTILVVNNTRDSQVFLLNPGFKADTLIWDPEAWILSLATVSKISCGPQTGADSLLPYFNVQWSQNSNGWVNVKVIQANPHAANSGARLYVHFAGTSFDTSFLLDDTKASYNLSFRLAKTVSTSFVAGPCFAANRWNIQQINQPGGKNVFSVYPVPAAGETLTVSLKNPTDNDLSLTITGTLGQILYRNRLQTPGSDLVTQVPVYTLPHGAYIVRITGASTNLSQKFIR